MADWTLTLTLEQELALQEMVAQWTIAKPETVWTPAGILAAVVADALSVTLRGMDSRLIELMHVVKRLSVPLRATVLQELPPRLRTRLEERLTRGET